jgi:hypothetical protein
MVKDKRKISSDSVKRIIDLIEAQQKIMAKDANAMMMHASKIQKHATLLQEQNDTKMKIFSTWYMAGNSGMRVVWRNERLIKL